MKIPITIEDIDVCIKFAVQYFLDPTKIKSNRTTGQNRGLGTIINDFLYGKLIEIGVKKALEKINSQKEIILDFELHEANADPDIITIKENNSERAPNLFVEIKNISENDRYIGLTAEQFNSILNHSSVNKNPQRIYLVFANIVSADEHADPFGVFLKSTINKDYLNEFTIPENLFIEIKNIINGEELIKKGVSFNQGDYFYETNIITSLYTDKYKDLIFRKIQSKEIQTTEIKNKKINKNLNEFGLDIPKQFGNFFLEGKCSIFLYRKSILLYSKSNFIIKNDFLGDFNLVSNEIHKISFDTIGRDPILKRNNVWLANRHLNSMNINLQERLNEIAKNI